MAADVMAAGAAPEEPAGRQHLGCCECYLCDFGRAYERLLEKDAEHEGDARYLHDVLGELVDAIHDEMSYDVRPLPQHVVDHLRRACEALGGPYKGYLSDWLAAAPADRQESGS